MPQSDPIIAGLMAPGAPFEVVSRSVEGRDVRVFKHMPENLGQVLNQARRFGDAEFIISGQSRITYSEFFNRADQLAYELVNEFGVVPGQSVSICMKNSPEWMIAFVAIQLVGGVAALINSRGAASAMCQAVDDSDSVLVIGDAPRLSKLRDAGCGSAMLDVQDFSEGPKFEKAADRLADDLSAMFFTSGTTGSAKAAAMSHRSLVTGTMNVQLAMAAAFMKMAKAYNTDVETLRAQMPQSCSLLIFPLFHISGCSAVFLTTLGNGGKLVLMDRWVADKALGLIETERVTTIGGVPAMYWDMLQSDRFDQIDKSSVMSISCGGSAFPPNLISNLQEKFPRAFIGAGYGMTETAGAISQANGEAFLKKPEASGQILPMMDVQITSLEGTPLPVGETGEIWVKGATLMSGYYGRTDDTARSMSGDWFKTGDIGKVDEDGYIYVVDRKTDMVISGGENIYCAEVEQVLRRHPDIINAVAFGIPDDRMGERLIASLQVKNTNVTIDDIRAFSQVHLANYAVPTEWAMQVVPFALNAMGKVEKHKIREAFLAGDQRKAG